MDERNSHLQYGVLRKDAGTLGDIWDTAVSVAKDVGNGIVNWVTGPVKKVQQGKQAYDEVMNDLDYFQHTDTQQLIADMKEAAETGDPAKVDAVLNRGDARDRAKYLIGRYDKYAAIMAAEDPNNWGPADKLWKRPAMNLVDKHRNDIANLKFAVDPNNLQPLIHLQRFQKGVEDDTNFIFTPAGRKHLHHVNNVFNNPTVLEWLKLNKPQQYAELMKRQGEIQWGYNNYRTLYDMQQMQLNPISWIITQLFSSDPSKLYQVARLWNGAYNNADAQSSYILNHTKNYSQYLPWLNAVADLRSTLGGDDWRKDPKNAKQNQ